jgi:stress response protein YsnF
VDRPATTADLTESSVEVRETAEQAVVAKTARVVEEVVVGKESSSRTETVNDTVRGTEVEVERVEGTDKTARVDEIGKKPI